MLIGSRSRALEQKEGGGEGGGLAEKARAGILAPMRHRPAPPPLEPAWWNDPRYAWALVLLCGAPLVWPSLPPLTDALGHLARYHVELAIDSSPWLHRYFAFKWALIGNLGVDLLVVPLAPIFGLQLVVKLIALTIPVLTATGLLLIAREVYGRVPPTFAFALPLTYGFPFQFGFLNHCLSMAFALLAFALWLRLARARRFGWRALLFVPLGGLIWLTHAFGWAVLCLLCFAAELVRDRGEAHTRLHALWRAGLSVLPLAPPFLLMLLWRSGHVRGSTGDWFDFPAKHLWLIEALRDRWKAFDVFSINLLCAIILFGLLNLLRSRSPWIEAGLARLSRHLPEWRLDFERLLGVATLFLVIAYIMLPRILLGSAYADMRLTPYALAIGLIALSPPRDSRRFASVLAVAGLIFFVARIGTNTWNFIGYDRAYTRQLRAIDHIAPGSRVLVLVNLQCNRHWPRSRMDHLGSQAIVRKDAFVNGQWVMPGAQLLSVTYAAAGRFATDPTQLLRPEECRAHNEPTLADTLAHFPRDAFDYFWLIDMPPERWVHDPGLMPIWHGKRGILYRVLHPQPASATIPSDTPKGNEPRPTQ